MFILTSFEAKIHIVLKRIFEVVVTMYLSTFDSWKNLLKKIKGVLLIFLVPRGYIGLFSDYPGMGRLSFSAFSENIM